MKVLLLWTSTSQKAQLKKENQETQLHANQGHNNSIVPRDISTICTRVCSACAPLFFYFTQPTRPDPFRPAESFFFSIQSMTPDCKSEASKRLVEQNQSGIRFKGEMSLLDITVGWQHILQKDSRVINASQYYRTKLEEQIVLMPTLLFYSTHNKVVYWFISTALRTPKLQTRCLFCIIVSLSSSLLCTLLYILPDTLSFFHKQIALVKMNMSRARCTLIYLPSLLDLWTEKIIIFFAPFWDSFSALSQQATCF